MLKKIWFFSLLSGVILVLSGCGNTSHFRLETENFSWSPALKVDLQELPAVEWNDVVYQQQGEVDSVWDTLVLASESNPETSLAGYVQNAINQLKTQWYTLVGEKTEKTKIKGDSAHHPAILKTYRITHQDTTLNVAQFFVEKGNTVLMLSYASDAADHTETFSKELSSLHLNF